MAKYADIKVGYKCCNNCVHCVVSNQRIMSQKLRNNEDRTTEECLKEIELSKKNGCDTIVITGGEPTERKDLIEILKFAKELDLKLTLQSNGNNLSDQNYCKDLCKYIDYFVIALHGSSKDIHDKITRCKDSFVKTIEGLKNLRLYTDKISVKAVISNYNKDDLQKIAKLVDSIGIKHINFAFPHANGNAAKNFKEVVPFYKSIKSEVERCIVFSENNNIFIDFESILPFALDNDYNIKYFSDFRNLLFKAELKQLDRNETVEWDILRPEIKRKFEACANCKYDTICEGYWKEYIDIRGYQEFQPVTR